MVEGNHWDQWFSDGFEVRQPLVTMVFDSCAPLHYGKVGDMGEKCDKKVVNFGN